MNLETLCENLIACGLRSWAVWLLPFFAEKQGYKPGRPTVLCLSRSHFFRDIAQLRRLTNINWIEIRSKYISIMQSDLVDMKKLPIEKAQTFYCASQHPDVVAARKLTDAWGAKMLARLRSAIRFDAVMTANTDYALEDGIKNACVHAGVPFLVLSKEHYVSGWLKDLRVGDYTRAGFKFNGDGVALFGDYTIPTLTETGACPREKIVVTGPPRLDVWRDVKLAEHGRNYITLISFSKGYVVESSFTETLHAFARASAANTNPEVEFIVKCKNGDDKKQVVRALQDTPQHRLKIVIGTPLHEILAQSRLVMGLNSLALLEALLSGAKLCLPHWGDARRDSHDLVLDPADPSVAACATFVPSPQEFERLLLDYSLKADPLPDPQPRWDILRRFFHLPKETSCSAEVERWVLSHLSQRTR